MRKEKVFRPVTRVWSTEEIAALAGPIAAALASRVEDSEEVLRDKDKREYE